MEILALKEIINSGGKNYPMYIAFIEASKILDISIVPNFKIDDYVEAFSAKRVVEGFNYDSGNNTEWETVESLRTLIKENVDPNFD